MISTTTFIVMLGLLVLVVGAAGAVIVWMHHDTVHKVTAAYRHSTSKTEDFATEALRAQKTAIEEVAKVAANMGVHNETTVRVLGEAIEKAVATAAEAMRPWAGSGHGDIIDPPESAQSSALAMGEAIDWTDHMQFNGHADAATLRPGESPIPGMGGPVLPPIGADPMPPRNMIGEEWEIGE